MHQLTTRNSLSLILYLCIGLITACDTQGGGDESCPENTIRSGEDCLPVSGEESGGIGPIAGEEAGIEGGTRAGTTAGSMGGTTAGNIAGETAGEMAPNIEFPIHVDDFFSPSGFMGEGEVMNISADFACPDGLTVENQVCHHFTYTPGDVGWGGVWWQAPSNNWGDLPGQPLPPGATSISFRAWGQAGGERLLFGSGYGGSSDSFAVELGEVSLEATPQTYQIDLAGITYEDIAGAFFWVTDESDEPIEFYIDQIVINADDSVEINPCTVGCSTISTVEDCSHLGYLACKASCEASLNGDCGSRALEYQTCVSENGWACLDGSVVADESCNEALIDLESCTGGPVAVSLPFYVEDQFVMSGYMGEGEVETTSCEEDDGGGACLKITWTPNGAEWVGFFFQYPENNWGEQPGLAINEGATHVRYRAWGELGDERANFGVGISDADGFNVEQGYELLSTEPSDHYLLLPEDLNEVTGAFSWFLENPNNADSITFYLDDIEWRDDMPPNTGMGIQGCTNSEADNYNSIAEIDDGSCIFPFTFSVDMSCAEVSFETVYITGPFCSWCDAGYPLTDEDGDQIWTGTYSFPEGGLEFKYMVDNFANQENLIGDGACAPVTDGSSYANRQINIEANGSTSHIYGRCSACDDEPPPAVDFETITFDDESITYTLTGFGGAENSTVVADPSDGANQVVQVVKSGTAELWAGTTVSTQANSAVGVIPMDAENTRITVRVWSPDAGIQVRLKVENSADNTVTVETEATTTVSNGWETLTFDFAQQATGTAAFNPVSTYDKLSIFFNFGITGAEAGEKTYYFDDITFIGGTTPPPEPMSYPITFEVDMNCPEAPETFNTVHITGPFCGWCGNGFDLTDEDGDGIWTGTFNFDSGDLEYKIIVDGFAGQEDLLDDVQAGDGACAPITDGAGYANRQTAITEASTLNLIYGRCSACTSGLGVDGILQETDGWRLTWSDEFNEATNTPIDSSKWVHDVGGGGWGNAQLEYNTNRVENSFQDGNGYLNIKAIREDYMGNQYTSARIKTQGLFSQQYGRFEAKIKLPYGQGLWPAFWLLGNDISTVGWPNCGEIDVMEFRGQNLYESTGALHGPNYSGGNSLYQIRYSAQSLAADFHTYAIEWSPSSIKWYVDNDLFMEKSPSDLPQGSTWAFDKEFFMILNVAVGGNFLGNPDGSTVFPQTMMVDYVRVYEPASN